MILGNPPAKLGELKDLPTIAQTCIPPFCWPRQKGDRPQSIAAMHLCVDLKTDLWTIQTASY